LIFEYDRKAHSRGASTPSRATAARVGNPELCDTSLKMELNEDSGKNSLKLFFKTTT